MKFYPLEYMLFILHFLNMTFTIQLLSEIKQKLQKVETKGDLQVKNKLRRNYSDRVICHCEIYTYTYTVLSSGFTWL